MRMVVVPQRTCALLVWIDVSAASADGDTIIWMTVVFGCDESTVQVDRRQMRYVAGGKLVQVGDLYLAPFPGANDRTRKTSVVTKDRRERELAVALRHAFLHGNCIRIHATPTPGLEDRRNSERVTIRHVRRCARELR